MRAVIDNTRHVYASVDDFTTGQDSSGADLPFPKTVERWRANAAISKGEALMFVEATTTVPISVTPMTAAIGTSDPWLFAGIALADAAAGDDVDVCVQGVCHVLMEDADAGGAFANAISVPDTTTGRCATTTGASTPVVGVQLSAEVGTTNFAVCKIYAGVPRVDDTP